MTGYVIFTAIPASALIGHHPEMQNVFSQYSPLPAIAVGGALAWLLFFAFNRLIRLGLRAPRILPQSSPASLGLSFQTVRIPTANDRQLGAWLIPSGSMGPALIVLHGWGSNSEMMLPLAQPLHAAGYTLLFVDARNHGMSDPDSFSSLPRFAEDLEHALVWLQQQPHIDARRIGLIGHSVGAAAAILTASRRQDVAAVVSLAAFAHPRAMMRRWLAEMRIPYWPLGWYILRYVQHCIGYSYDAIAPRYTIAQVACPVLLVHGDQDVTVPVQEAREIHGARTLEGVELLVLEGGHGEFEAIGAHIDALIAFLDRALRQN